MTLGPAAFDRHVLSLDEASLVQSVVNRASAHRAMGGGRREDTEETDHRHRLLLRVQGTCRGCGGCERGNEAPTVHSIFKCTHNRAKTSTKRHGRGPTLS